MFRVWHRRQVLLLLMIVAGAAQGGCNGRQALHMAGNEIVSAPPETISVYQLAGRLDMDVVESAPTAATFQDSQNLVLVFGGRNGRVYVNGLPVGETVEIACVRNMLFVPAGLEPRIRQALRPRRIPPKREAAPPRLGCVVLDPGHGGKDPGAISVLGFSEKSVNLSVALMVADRLKRSDVDVRMTRQTDCFLELDERAELANQCRADLFVSIHSDSAANRSASGFTLYVSGSPSSRSRSSAFAIARALELAGLSGRGVRGANYRVLVRATCPAVLVELGYLSNHREAGRLCEEGYQQRLAEAIAEGIVAYLKQK